MLTIGDLVHMDTQGTFRSDVQLSDYDNRELNLELLGHYIFTTKAPETHGSVMMRRVSALDVLETLRHAFTVDRVENRITIVANYGHGKSHLALTLANYFARPHTSDENKTVFQRLGQALDNPTKLTGYQQFKEAKGEFLVVRLRGDSPVTLREQFLKGLGKALQEHTVTQGVELPFWYKKAEESLKGLGGAELRIANEYLTQYEMDVPDLLANLQQEGARERCREVFRAVYGFVPDFGDEISLKDAVIWVVDEFCGLNKPLGGLLILFDEFSLFIQRYTRSRPGGDLQDLLNGVEDRQGRAAFVAFSQHDPHTIAENYASGQVLESVKKELTRLPSNKAFALYSLMESVIYAYLKQSDREWEEWLSEQRVKSYFAQAREITLLHFSRRYINELQWSLETFAQIVVMGCFPLHPLTTAILSTHKFQAGEDIGTARTVLGFIQREMEENKDQPALLDGHPNVTLPIALVEYFEERLSKDAYEAYQAAIDTAAERLTETHRRVLLALFLQTATGIQTRASDQLELLAQMSGLSFEETKKALNELAHWNAIQFDPIQKVSSFWPTRTHPRILEDSIKRALDEIVVDQPLLGELSKMIEPLEVSAGFGHRQDWAATQKVLPSQFFTPSQLQAYARAFRVGPNNIEEGDRGLVVWLLAQDDEEKLKLRQQAAQVLDQAFDEQEYPLPIVVMLPQKPIPEVIEAFRRLKAIKGLSQTERQKIGEHAYEQEFRRSDIVVRNLIAEIRGGVEQYQDISHATHEIAVPAPYRTAVKALKYLSLKDALRECYRLAYVRPEFYDQFQVGGKGPNKLRDAVKKVSLWLIEDGVGAGIHTLSQNDIQKQLCEKYLSEKWGLLSAGTYAIQEPLQRSLRNAWDYLERAFAPGCQDCLARQAFIDLLNPPYGHDYHTLILLFTAWVGYHQHELRFALGGSTASVQQIKQYFDTFKNTRDFLDAVCCSTSPLTIGRSKPDEILHEASALVERIRRGDTFTQEKAEDALARLEQALSNPRLQPSQREDVERARQRLYQALQTSQDYDQKAEQILESIQKLTLDTLLKQQDTFAAMPQLALVSASTPPLDDLKSQWEQALAKAVEATCEQYGTLHDIGEQKAHEQALQSLHQRLHNAGRTELAKTVEQALAHLNQQANELRKTESEKAIVAGINGMSPSASLKELYAYHQRLKGLGEVSEGTKRLRDERLNSITRRIAQFETLAQELPLAIDRAKTSAELEQQRVLLLRNLDYVEGTELHPALVEAEKRIERLRAFFEDLKAIEKTRVETPQDVENINQQIQNLQKRFASAMSPSQMELLQQTEQNLEQKVEQGTKEARQWLESIQQQISRNENPEELLKTLDAPHPFLPREDTKRLNALKIQAQEKLEHDILAHIERLFRKILDPKIRQECLARLQKVVEQNDR